MPQKLLDEAEAEWRWPKPFDTKDSDGLLHYTTARQTFADKSFRDFHVGDTVMLSKLLGAEREDLSLALLPKNVHIVQIIDMVATKDKDEGEPFSHMRLSFRWFYCRQGNNADTKLSAVKARDPAPDGHEKAVGQDEYFYSDFVDQDCINSVNTVLGFAQVVQTHAEAKAQREKLAEGQKATRASLRDFRADGARGSLRLGPTANDKVVVSRWFYHDDTVKWLPPGALAHLLGKSSFDINTCQAALSFRGGASSNLAAARRKETGRIGSAAGRKKGSEAGRGRGESGAGRGGTPARISNQSKGTASPRTTIGGVSSPSGAKRSVLPSRSTPPSSGAMGVGEKKRAPRFTLSEAAGGRKQPAPSRRDADPKEARALPNPKPRKSQSSSAMDVDSKGGTTLPPRSTTPGGKQKRQTRVSSDSDSDDSDDARPLASFLPRGKSASPGAPQVEEGKKRFLTLGKPKAARGAATPLSSRRDSESKDERHAASSSRRKSVSAMDVEGKKRGRGIQNDLHLTSGRVEKKARLGSSSIAVRELVEKVGEVGKNGKKRKRSPLDGIPGGNSKKLHTDRVDAEAEPTCLPTAGPGQPDEPAPVDDLTDVYASSKSAFAQLGVGYSVDKEDIFAAFNALSDEMDALILQEGGLDELCANQDPESVKAELLKRAKAMGH